MTFFIHPTCKIDPTATIEVKSGYIGPNSIINKGVTIQGYKVEIGRESYIDKFAVIGGGSCYDSVAFLSAGDWFHMGMNSQVNIARGVTVGHEVGIGVDSKIFTHGAYLDCWSLGAPVQWGSVILGDHVWLPNAWVNPGVTIGSHVVVGARSLVNSNIPSGSLAAGSPARVLKANYYPHKLSPSDKVILLRSLCLQIAMRVSHMPVKPTINHSIEAESIEIDLGGQSTTFYLGAKTITGVPSEASALAKDQLRRNGIRFRLEEVDGQWVKW